MPIPDNWRAIAIASFRFSTLDKSHRIFADNMANGYLNSRQIYICNNTKISPLTRKNNRQKILPQAPPAIIPFQEKRLSPLIETGR
ncbi:hypothetical protein [Trinickia sp.]|uniref:hypothetical protein n=1 Tax=Trinickia sp. TaxID=2571163 RepID=UPI003F81AC2C